MPYYDVNIRTITEELGLDVPAVPAAVTVANDNPVVKATPDISRTNTFRVEAVTLKMKSGAVVPTVGEALS
jgi:hypothetical protein